MECTYCEYKTNCKLGLYAVSPCECETIIIRPLDVFAPVRYAYQNPITGKMQETPLDLYYVANPFMYNP